MPWSKFTLDRVASTMTGVSTVILTIDKIAYRIFSIISAVLIFFQHPFTPCLYWRPCLYFFNQYIHTEQEEIHARYHACSIDFHQDRANNRDCAYNVSKGAHSVLVLETVLVMETCAYNREYTVYAMHGT